MVNGKAVFLSTLTRIIERAPGRERLALLIALDCWRLSGSEVSEIELVEAIVEGLSEEIARACFFTFSEQETMQ